MLREKRFFFWLVLKFIEWIRLFHFIKDVEWFTFEEITLLLDPQSKYCYWSLGVYLQARTAVKYVKPERLFFLI